MNIHAAELRRIAASKDVLAEHLLVDCISDMLTSAICGHDKMHYYPCGMDPSKDDWAELRSQLSNMGLKELVTVRGQNNRKGLAISWA